MKPILFNTAMVLAILRGDKTHTRRVVKPQPISERVGMVHASYCGRHGEWFVNGAVSEYNLHGHEVPVWIPPYLPGDVLWVRETWQPHPEAGMVHDSCSIPADAVCYAADFTEAEQIDAKPWKPSIHMPRCAARLFLKVTNVRAERLQDITEADAKAEGIERTNWQYSCEPYRNYEYKKMAPGINCSTAIRSFKTLWDYISKDSLNWDANPWVWVYEFEITDEGMAEVPE